MIRNFKYVSICVCIAETIDCYGMIASDFHLDSKNELLLGNFIESWSALEKGLSSLKDKGSISGYWKEVEEINGELLSFESVVFVTCLPINKNTASVVLPFWGKTAQTLYSIKNNILEDLDVADDTTTSQQLLSIVRQLQSLVNKGLENLNRYISQSEESDSLRQFQKITNTLNLVRKELPREQ